MNTKTYYLIVAIYYYIVITWSIKSCIVSRLKFYLMEIYIMGNVPRRGCFVMSMSCSALCSASLRYIAKHYWV